MSQTANREVLRRFVRKGVEWYKTCAILLLHTLVLFVILNLVLLVIFRIKDSSGDPAQAKPIDIRYQVYGESVVAKAYPDLSKEERDRLLHETWSRPVEYEPFTQFKEPAFSGKYVNVDRHGFRLIKNQGPWPPPPGKLSIFVFGGSTTFGYGVADDQTIPSYLQEYLRKHLSQEVYVYNFGRCFYYSTQERILFEKLLAAGRAPRLALFIDGINDVNSDPDNPMYTEQLEKALKSPDLNGHSKIECVRTLLADLPAMRAARSLKGRLSPSAGQEPPPLGDEGNSEDDERATVGRIERYIANKGLIEAAAAGHDVPPVFAWQPSPTYKYNLKYHLFAKDRFGSAWEQSYAIMARIVQERPKVFSNNFLWLADAQQDAREPLYVDRVHYAPRFCQELAALIGRQLRERKLLPDAGS